MRKNLNDWWLNNIPDENLIYKDGLKKQCSFVRDKLMFFTYSFFSRSIKSEIRYAPSNPVSFSSNTM